MEAGGIPACSSHTLGLSVQAEELRVAASAIAPCCTVLAGGRVQHYSLSSTLNSTMASVDEAGRWRPNPDCFGNGASHSAHLLAVAICLQHELWEKYFIIP